MKIKVNTLILLCVVAAIGVITLQVSWLSASYQITRDKIKIDGVARFEQAIALQKENAAKQIRSMIINGIRSQPNFYINITNGEFRIGYNGPDGKIWNIVPLFNLSEEESVEARKDAYEFFLKRIGRANIEELKYILNYAVGPHDINLNREKLHKAFDFHKDTATLARFLRNSSSKGQFTYEARYYEDVQEFLGPLPALYTENKVMDSTVSLTSPYFELSIDEKHAMLENYINKVNKSGKLIYIAQPLFDLDGILNNQSPVILLKIEVSKIYVLSQMVFSLFGSALLLVLLGFCLIYMFHTILKQKRLSEIKDDFISNVSHELKTPVATTLAAVQGMQHFGVLKDQEKTERYLGTVEKEMNRLSNMIDTILNNAIYERSDFNLHEVKFNLKEMLTEIITIQESHSKKEVEIELKYLADEEMFGDKTHLHNVFVNLIDNAIKYGKENVTIKIECENTAAGVKVKIEDNGNGIPSAYQKNIFDKFFRVPSPTDHSVKGHGLGLNYVRNIIEKHNGTISLLKSDDTGSTFEINLPK